MKKSNVLHAEELNVNMQKTNAFIVKNVGIFSFV